MPLEALRVDGCGFRKELLDDALESGRCRKQHVVPWSKVLGNGPWFLSAGGGRRHSWGSDESKESHDPTSV